ncbi:Cobyrinic acid ac-diamide synthase [Desulfarculus baarsii DSM 2075]|uniref:Cobyrinic acid ac-diamide synthase n=1 Tax=Desulfarculus baarsii (strain ATCC 33931 / DSM 2075 / LMG 7858 / VKM B-1802 / 2st14) TaxID=644282 RepID=E1QJE0_DESB2|nr:MinD/ParA family protein [Desulfarculus baarsii]ADK85683.1 Cobyrinic acid ac-diamide synthase [Desulfarculus baarsii DSM 2075]
MDQATSLRRMAERPRQGASSAPPLRTMAITSGKGGVGKTNITVNLALCLARLGRKVLIIDADLGLANVDIVLGLNPQYTIRDVIHGDKTLDEVILEGPGGVQILPATSGVAEMTSLTKDEKMMLLQVFDSYQLRADTVIIDTAAGINDTVLYFNSAAQERIVVATGEPTSLTDAYALIKVMYTTYQEKRFRLLVNNVKDAAEAKQVYRKLAAAADHFLDGLAIDYVGHLPTDLAVHKAVMQQRPVVEAFPTAEISRAFAGLAKEMLERPSQETDGNIKFFWRRLVAMS